MLPFHLLISCISFIFNNNATINKKILIIFNNLINKLNLNLQFNLIELIEKNLKLIDINKNLILKLKFINRTQLKQFEKL